MSEVEKEGARGAPGAVPPQPSESERRAAQEVEQSEREGEAAAQAARRTLNEEKDDD